ncbi:MAG: NADH-quinone oxidoreductase subunit N [Candidatus Zixiibacteriota bacterium]|nr:MAG: NADH-quinone oxidoreductase subunit N [candidate division Zixibacteria bacterium]
MIDFTSASIDFSMIGPEIALLVSAFIILLLASNKSLSKFGSSIGFIGLAISLYLAVGQWGDQQSGFFGMVSCDNFGVAFKIIFSTLSIIVLLSAPNYFTFKNINRSEFYALLNISTMGMMVMANSTDLIVIFLGLEIMSIPLYVMAAFARRSLESNEAGIKYLIMGSFASAFLLLGIAFIYGSSGTTDLRRLVTDYHYIISNYKLYLYSGASLILVGFGFKVGTVPFHSWVPDVYQGAPTPITGFFSVVPKAAAFAVLMRIFSFGFSALDELMPVFWVLAVITMTVGNVLALRQDNVKRMLAYSSIAHAGYILVAFAVGNSESVSSAMFYLVGYGLFNLGAFAIIALIETRSNGKANFSELAGISKANPYLTAILALFMFALSGFPPTIGFFGKFYIFSNAVKDGFILLAVIGVMNSFISVYYYLRVIKVSYFEKTEIMPTPIRMPVSIIIVLLITALGTLGLGFFPQQLLEFTNSAIFAFL